MTEIISFPQRPGEVGNLLGWLPPQSLVATSGYDPLIPRVMYGCDPCVPSASTVSACLSRPSVLAIHPSFFFPIGAPDSWRIASLDRAERAKGHNV
ncbi:MAG TPA: hypothetical protein VKR06_01915 [Ktedonosporobacter sp.]|nr:hypothetical protein [Ktedonosporobacter sp.]